MNVIQEYAMLVLQVSTMKVVMIDYRDKKNDVKNAIIVSSDIAKLIKKFFHKHNSVLLQDQKRNLIGMGKEYVVEGLKMKDYFVKADIAADPKKAKLQSAENKGSKGHFMTDEEVKLKLFEECRVIDFHTTFDDIVGQEEGKEIMKNIAVKPFAHKHLVSNTKPLQACLMFGPPGVGKSSLVIAAGHAMKEFGGNFFKLSTDLVKKSFHGQSERYAKLLVELARDHTPAILFLDECDALCSQRSGDEHVMSSIKAVLIDELQIEHPKNKGLVLVGASNFPMFIDSAFLRRFQQPIYVSMPQIQVLNSCM